MKQPQKKDDWFYCIKDTIINFQNIHKYTPTQAELWSSMITNSPAGYGVNILNSKKYGLALKLSESSLDRKAFNKRYLNYYPTKKGPDKPH